MFFFHFVYALVWAMIPTLAAASYELSNVAMRALDVLDTLERDTVRTFNRGPHANRIYGRHEVLISNHTSIEMSWNNATLLSLSDETSSQQSGSKSTLSGQTSLKITCVQCYVKGEATARLTVDDGFNFTEYAHQLKDEVENFSKDVASEVEDHATNGLQEVLENFEDLNITQNFNIFVPDIPGSMLHIELNGLELYAQLDVKLSGQATYTLNLYTSKSLIGAGVKSNEFVGVVFSIDLILSSEAAIEIGSGFHIKLEDGIVIDIPMFKETFGSINFEGGRFEFLPVTLVSAGAVLRAVLRVGAHVGFEISGGNGIGTISNRSLDFSAGAGVAASIFVDVADFVTSVSVENDTCELKVEESYSLAIGAVAGASVALQTHTWGPTPNTTTAIFYTTLGATCMKQSATAPTTTEIDFETTAGVEKRDLITTVLTTVETYSGIECRSQGLVNCPVSLQHTTKHSSTRTTIMSVSEDETATFPASTQTTVLKTSGFGSNAKSLLRTSGSPTSYEPPPPTSTSKSNPFESQSHDNTHTKHIALGVGLGLGIPIIAITIAGISIYIYRRQNRREKTFPGAVDGKGEAVPQTAAQDPLAPIQHEERKVMDAVMT